MEPTIIIDLFHSSDAAYKALMNIPDEQLFDVKIIYKEVRVPITMFTFREDLANKIERALITKCANNRNHTIEAEKQAAEQLRNIMGCLEIIRQNKQILQNTNRYDELRLTMNQEYVYLQQYENTKRILENATHAKQAAELKYKEYVFPRYIDYNLEEWSIELDKILETGEGLTGLSEDEALKKWCAALFDICPSSVESAKGFLRWVRNRSFSSPICAKMVRHYYSRKLGRSQS